MTVKSFIVQDQETNLEPNNFSVNFFFQIEKKKKLFFNKKKVSSSYKLFFLKVFFKSDEVHKILR